MTLTGLLSDLLDIAKDNNVSTPYIVGGLVRDKLLGKVNDIKDIDLTTGDETIAILAAKFVEKRGASFKKMKDGHIRAFYKNLQLDFSSNFRVPGIHHLLEKGGVKSPTVMQKELFSRDFTCNAALMTLDLSHILDPLGRSVKDVNAKVMKACLSPDLTFGYMPRRILRLINLMARLDFDCDIETKKFIKNNIKLIDSIDPEYLRVKLLETLVNDKTKVIEIIKDLGLHEKFKSLPQTMDLV